MFLKGCPLDCPWCSNPESKDKDPQIMFNPNLCIDCKKCIEICPNNAVDFNLRGRIVRDKCNLCMECVDHCYSKALSIEGIEGSVEELLFELNKDRIHYRRSNGGITFSGGEALYQSDFLLELLKGCKANGWHTTIETAGYYPKETLEKIIPWTDLFLYDIKMIDDGKHKKVIGVSNKRILANAKFAAASSADLVVRTPIIPGFNDDKESVSEIAEFALDLKGVKRIDILPYHRLGEDKYYGLGQKYQMKDIESPSNEKMEQIKELIIKKGIDCTIGGVE
ncbi:glycerol dehydratase, cobalamin-independent, small subunit [Halanaerobium congolense]|uniref:Cobalamin-independent glycerol dehydratase small subunit n=1 Tax=Halanaerobium congolense TaxID=54121 RepID=A0A1G6TLV8_9FIRM|nr:MAG: pyruvate formate lyase activating enzyme [Halanaerobium sp. T82-1]PUU92556.1 MAG: pyruvate formate lyase activating enzyme [Halanaerobium sp.]TDP13747.1 cobalamin-independent glycerol dehydratase small subunit [Halanaerobium congolense]TDX40316.1 cobalamin-independent glycerol dehydratase small subunit [Halanaerobium congolense]SDD30040.1 glycerol dehydratase, cobalamin-independent, small subunit [Halanaerobium congolense]